MAKPKKVEILAEGVQLVSEELETKLKSNLKRQAEVEVKEDLGEIQIIKEEPTVVPQKMVKILMKEDHKCFIGGEWYFLLKGKHYNVPENVKAILIKADKLQPL